MQNQAGTRYHLVALPLALVLAMTPAHAESTGDDAALREIIEAVRKGWLQANGEPFREHFLDFEDARYIETGGQNEGLSDLIENHVEPEGDVLKSFTLVFDNIETHIEGDFAWALTDVEVKARLRHDRKKIHSRGYETFLFRKIGNEWKIVHTHSSSRPVKKR